MTERDCSALHGTEPHDHCPVCGDIAHSGVPLNCGLGLGHRRVLRCNCMTEDDGTIETPSGSCPEHGWMVKDPA